MLAFQAFFFYWWELCIKKREKTDSVLQIVFSGVAKGKKSFWQLSVPVSEPCVARRGGRAWEGVSPLHLGVSPEKIFVELTPNGAILHTFEAILLSVEIFHLPSEILSSQKNVVSCQINLPVAKIGPFGNQFATLRWIRLNWRERKGKRKDNNLGLGNQSKTGVDCWTLGSVN